MKRLYIHIGHYKTGTSAIQKYCSDNARALAEAGYFYPPVARPGNNPTNHGDLSLLLAAKHGFNPPPWYGANGKDIETIYAAFLDSARAARQQNILVSSEEFFQLGLRADPAAALAELKDRLAEFDVRIVLYIREPLALLKSWYNELNKGPHGTRSFPVFFRNIDPDFLAQTSVWRRFAEAFGEPAMIVRSYKHTGLDHIRDFLAGIGCDHVPKGQDVRVQEAQDLETLELARIAKRGDADYDETTLSRFGPVQALAAKVARINTGFAEISARSDMPQDSQLSLAGLFAHHERLIAPLVARKCMNDKEAEILRDAALALAPEDPAAALVLMRTAHAIRPKGPFIAQKLQEYEAAEG